MQSGETAWYVLVVVGTESDMRMVPIALPMSCSQGVAEALPKKLGAHKKGHTTTRFLEGLLEGLLKEGLR